ncbi:helix-turn-helix transcriptional regulator [Luteimicrobium sp. NPDC057192]|uniref:helix-turn-helix transcriptional regulator n=1 Tax=Luteimicrobium sp. NPDC057192 TaxID=3346042 RepID=UPI0036344C85
MPSQIPPAERLLNLVIALVNAPSSMSKQQVRTSVAGYGDAPSPDAFERMFERDKDTLRELGIPVLTVDAGGHSDDVGYRVDLDAYTLAPVDLTSAELGVLSLAAQFWQDKTLRTDTARALTKLRAAGRGDPGVGDSGTDVVAGLTPRVRAAGRAFGPLLDAIQDRRPVRFTYRAASTGEVREREVEPWRLAARRGGWYVLGRDRDREAPRAFRLSRIEGNVRPSGAPRSFELPAEVDVDAFLSGRGGRERVARLAVVPERAGAVRARAARPERTYSSDVSEDPMTADGRDVLEVPFTGVAGFASELAGYADAIVVLDPPDLRDAVVARLRTAASLDVAGDGRRGADDETGVDRG